MKKFGLIGYPLTHSFSPNIQKRIYELYNIDASYSLIEISPKLLNRSSFKNQIKYYDGLNVTIPFKSEVINFLDVLSIEAGDIGAVNTLKNENNKWIGYNTDIDGFLYPLQKYFNKINCCILLGTGGAAKAAVYAINKYIQPKRIIIAARSPEKAEKLKKTNPSDKKSPEIICKSVEDIYQITDRADLIVNATPVGMYPNVKDSILHQKYKLKRKAIVYDLIYNPIQTTFLKQSQIYNPNCITINGTEMLIAQAAKSIGIWTGKEISIDNVINYFTQNNFFEYPKLN